MPCATRYRSVRSAGWRIGFTSAATWNGSSIIAPRASRSGSARSSFRIIAVARLHDHSALLRCQLDLVILAAFRSSRRGEADAVLVAELVLDGRVSSLDRIARGNFEE